jgi:hypothetical protein
MHAAHIWPGRAVSAQVRRKKEELKAADAAMFDVRCLMFEGKQNRNEKAQRLCIAECGLRNGEGEYKREHPTSKQRISDAERVPESRVHLGDARQMAKR